MRTVADIMGLWPSEPEFAQDIGVTPKHARTMRDRGSIPPRYWADLIAAAKSRRLGLTIEALVQVAAAKPKARAS